MAEGNTDHVAELRWDEGSNLAALGSQLETAREMRAYSIALHVAGSPEPPETGDLRWLERFPLPIVASFEDRLAGLPAAIALACDIRVCGPMAELAAPAASKPRLARLVHDTGALHRLVDGASFDAPALEATGLVSAVTPAGGAAAEAVRIAAVIATRGPIAVRLAKEAIWRGLEMPLEQGLRFETDLTLLLQTTNDRAEGVRAFLEKRAPRFTGE